MLGEDYPVCESPSKFVSTSNDVVTRLQERQARLKAELAKVDAAIEALEKNPEVANILKLVTAAANC